MSHEDSREDQNQPEATSQQPQTINDRLRELSRNPRTGGSKFVKLSGLGPISMIPIPSIPPPPPDLSREQLKALLIDFLDLLIDSKPLKQVPEPDPEDPS